MKTVVITGAAGMLCRGFAKALAADGNRVALIGRNEKNLADLKKELVNDGFIANYYVADVTDECSMQRVHDEIFEDFGGCDILINGAGGNHPSASTGEEYVNLNSKEIKNDFFGLKRDGFSFVFDLNLWGTVLPCQIFAEDMVKKGKGCVLNISSMAAYSPLTKTPAYCAAKAGISNFTQWLAVHLAPSGVRVNAIAPGFFWTPLQPACWVKEKIPSLGSNSAMARGAMPYELASTFVFLASDEASYITGVVLSVDGMARS